MRHWPLDPLLALARNRDGERMSKVELSKLLGFSEGTVQGWYRSGIPGDEKAERAAVALGFDPANVWPDWYDVQLADVAIRCEDCDEAFVPFNKRQRFCSDACRRRKWGRVNYRLRDDLRQKRSAYRRDYYAHAAEYERKRERDRYWSDPEAARERQRMKRVRQRQRKAASDGSGRAA